MRERGKAESVLWEYRKNERKFRYKTEELRGLLSVHGQSYETHVLNGVNKPVEAVLMKRLTLEKQIKELRGKLRVVEQLEERLSPDEVSEYQMLGILRLRYKEHDEPREVMRKL